MSYIKKPAARHPKLKVNSLVSRYGITKARCRHFVQDVDTIL
ncbi:MAG: hypothetical protein Ct9H300mP15_01750 [Gemmatimonadota bacterium]|nr:MAG: hypothetical protein Ct9H300mP15_01750 [Gemmatimonadota bacterium]